VEGGRGGKEVVVGRKWVEVGGGEGRRVWGSGGGGGWGEGRRKG